VNTEAAELAERAEDASSRVTTLYRRHAPGAGRLAYLLTGDPHLAEDLAQEAFVRLIGRLGRIRDEAAIDAYLRRSVVNLARKQWRRRATQRAYLRRERPDSINEEASADDFAARDELWGALGKLPYRQRAAIVLRFYEDLTEQETARALGCAVGTVKSSVSRGLQRMREELERNEAD
jgi:RNA polymerase sigma-70 factor (sigma-E family)